MTFHELRWTMLLPSLFSTLKNVLDRKYHKYGLKVLNPAAPKHSVLPARHFVAKCGGGQFQKCVGFGAGAARRKTAGPRQNRAEALVELYLWSCTCTCGAVPVLVELYLYLRSCPCGAVPLLVKLYLYLWICTYTCGAVFVELFLWSCTCT